MIRSLFVFVVLSMAGTLAVGDEIDDSRPEVPRKIKLMNGISTSGVTQGQNKFKWRPNRKRPPSPRRR